MPLIAKDAAPEREPIPLGMHQAVCAFVEDLGMDVSPTSGKLQHKCVIVWEINEKMTNGQRFDISQRYTVSLNEKANLRKALESWRGRPFTAEELEGFDLEMLIGANCMLNLIEDHAKTSGKKFTKIASVSPIIKGMPKIAPEGKEPPKWIAEEREKNAKAAGQATAVAEDPEHAFGEVEELAAPAGADTSFP